jgi:hypothetical protein
MQCSQKHLGDFSVEITLTYRPNALATKRQSVKVTGAVFWIMLWKGSR